MSKQPDEKPDTDLQATVAMRSIEDSLQRLGTNRLDVVFVHDTDAFTHGSDSWMERQDEALDGAVKALETLRDEGVIAAYGFGVNEWEVCHRAAQRADVDCFLLGWPLHPARTGLPRWVLASVRTA